MSNKTPKDYGLISNKLELDAFSSNEVDSPLDLSAEDFLRFAEADIHNIRESTDKDIINCLSNVKRAIEHRIDLLLYAFGYPNLEEHWNFPKKIDTLKGIGIIAPRILGKINKIRNLLEHEYKLPNRGEVEDAIDIASLFLEYTKNFIYNFVNNFCCYDNEKSVDFTFIDHKQLDVVIIYYNSHEECKFTVTYKDPTYYDWLKIFISVAY